MELQLGKANLMVDTLSAMATTNSKKGPATIKLANGQEEKINLARTYTARATKRRKSGLTKRGL